MLHVHSRAVKIPPRVVLAESFGDEARICCPVCGCKQVHMTGIIANDGLTTVQLCAESSQIHESLRNPGFPGSFSCTHFFCEQGHEFRYLFRFANRTTQFIVMASGFDPEHGFPRELVGG